MIKQVTGTRKRPEKLERNYFIMQNIMMSRSSQRDMEIRHFEHECFWFSCDDEKLHSGMKP